MNTFRRSHLTAFAVLWMSSSAHAAIIRSLNEHIVIEAPISQKALTRIAVKNDRIRDVFGVSGEYVLEADEGQGQVFIRPTTGTQPISLTLTTEKGHTQDLRLLPKDQPPQALLLEERSEEQSVTNRGSMKGKIVPDPPLIREDVEDLLKACQEGRIPLGYKQVPLDLTTLKQEGGNALLVREIRSRTLRGLTYEVKNTGNIPLILADPGMSGTLGRVPGLSPREIVAVIQSKTVLNPNEGVQIYVVARRK